MPIFYLLKINEINKEITQQSNVLPKNEQYIAQRVKI
ncbi:hypothetical protein XM72_c20910 [Vibrio vulnificus]|nr:hypothetical protein XM72_c20910 [Vibrio vulnificus]